MRILPLDHPGTAAHTSPGAFLWWLARGQWQTLAGGMAFGIVWMSCQAVMPAVIGRAIDRGVAAKDGSALLTYAGLMLAIGLVQAVTGIMRHRFAVTNWLTAAYRTVQLVGRQAVHLGGALPRKVSTGEVVAIGTNDISNLGQVMDVSARFSGAIVSFLLVAVILLSTSVPLGLLVLIGVPALMLLIGPLLRPLARRSAHQRHLMGELSNTASDIVGGLRVLRGIGGEQVFHDRYRRESQHPRGRRRVARLQSVLDALQVFLPGVFVVRRGLAGCAVRGAGPDQPGRAGGVLRLRGVPDDPAAHRHRVRQQADPGPGLGAAGSCQVLALTPDHLDPAEPARPAARAPSWPTRGPACGSVPGCSPRWSATSPTRRRRWQTGSACAPPSTTTT